MSSMPEEIDPQLYPALPSEGMVIHRDEEHVGISIASTNRALFEGILRPLNLLDDTVHQEITPDTKLDLTYVFALANPESAIVFHKYFANTLNGIVLLQTLKEEGNVMNQHHTESAAE